LITPEIQEKFVHAHSILRENLGDNNNLIDFYSDDKIASHMTIQDNILFGRIAYRQANAQQKVGKLINSVISELNLGDQIIDVGLNYSVGVAGARLTSVQRQRLTIARALVKNPAILVINEATSLFDKNTEQSLVEKILEMMKSRTVMWVLGNTDHVDKFDKLLVLDKGQVVVEGSADEVRNREDIFSKLN
jgi:putative ABC transport system ATP-binding protein